MCKRGTGARIAFIQCSLKWALARTIREPTATILLPNSRMWDGTRRDGEVVTGAKCPINGDFPGQHITRTDAQKRISSAVHVNQTSVAEALPLLANRKSITSYPERLNHRTWDIAVVTTDRIGMREFLLAIC